MDDAYLAQQFVDVPVLLRNAVREDIKPLHELPNL